MLQNDDRFMVQAWPLNLAASANPDVETKLDVVRAGSGGPERFSCGSLRRAPSAFAKSAPLHDSAPVDDARYPPRAGVDDDDILIGRDEITVVAAAPQSTNGNIPEGGCFDPIRDHAPTAQSHAARGAVLGSGREQSFGGHSLPAALSIRKSRCARAGYRERTWLRRSALSRKESLTSDQGQAGK